MNLTLRAVAAATLLLGAVVHAPVRAADTPAARPAAAASQAEGASAKTAAIESFTPRGATKAVRQAQARFTTPMVALGDPRQPDPFAVDCAAPGRGRWIDPRAWVYDFDADLPGGLRCSFTPRPGLQDLAGRPVSAPKSFAFDTGGPAVVASLPEDGNETIDESQAFLLRLDAGATPESIRRHARCVVAGLAEEVPVVLLEGAERQSVLEQARKLGFRYDQLLSSTAEPAAGAERLRARPAQEAAIAMVRCQRPLPPATQVQLVWGRGIAAPSGLATTRDQKLVFRVRPQFSARIECQRVNAQAGCLPFKPIEVRFSSPVPRDLALALRLQTSTGIEAPRATVAAAAPVLDAIRFDAPFAPSGTVKVTLPAGLVDDAGRGLANASRFPLEVRIDEYPPLAKFPGTFGVIEAREGGVLPVTLRNLDEPAPGSTTATLAARRVRVGPDPASLADWLRRVERAGEPRGEPVVVDRKTGRTEWRELTGSTSVFVPADAAATFPIAKPAGAREFEVVGIPLAQPGLHVVELESLRLGRSLLGAERPRYVATAALVTDLAVHFKWGRESSLAWVTRLHDGRPVAGAQVTVANYCGGATRWTGSTDRDGLARMPVSFGDPVQGLWCEDKERQPLLVLASLGDDFSFALSSWTQGIDPWDFGLQAGSRWEMDLTHTVLDRALFRPGETVSMKHFLRRHHAGGVAVAPDLPAQRKVVIQHFGSEQRFDLVATFDASGIAEQQWAIPAGARTGDYGIAIDDGTGNLRPGAQFKVEDFRLPTMRAEVSGPASPLVRPASVPLDLRVAYLSGGGASGLPVTLRTYVEPRPVSFKDYADYVFGGDPVREGVETLGRGGDEADDDAGDDETSGDAVKVQERPLTLDANGAARVDIRELPALDSGAVLTAELQYPDANGEVLTATGRVRLNPSAVHLGLRRDGWVAAADRLRFRVVALDLDGRPLPKQAVAVSAWHVQGYSYRKRLVGGFYAYESLRETRRLDAGCRGTTDARGEFDCEIAPGVSGEVRLRAETTDAQGRGAGATASAWIAGADDWWFGGTSGDRMDVLAEKPEYESGQRARFQVRMPFRKATALVTVEREGVLDAYVRTLDGRKPVVEVPVAANHAPNVYVSVLAVRGRIERPEAKRGDKTAATTPATPAITGLVDLYKPAFRLGTTAIRVGWKPHRLDVAVVPDQAVYGVREQADVTVRVRRADGGALPAGAEVALAAVDEGLLELAPNRSWQLLEAMMATRGLEVWTSTAQMQVVGKRHYGRKAVPHGGGGGRDRARQSFETLLAWQARVPLDARGEARVRVPLNDSLTSFRIVAVASAGAASFGTGSAGIATTQDVIVLPGLPALVREGDRFLATYSVRNTTQRALTLQLQPTVTPAPAGPLATQTVELPPGAVRDVTWETIVPAGATSLAWDLVARKADGATADRVQIAQRVVPAVPPRVLQATFAQVAGAMSVPVSLPAGALPGRGGVSVELRAKLADNLDGLRDWMRSYPYSCLEQSLSRTLALGDRAQWDAWMQRLPAYQDDDGLLRFFPSPTLPGEDSLTAYVLATAPVAGWEIPATARQRMIEGLQGFVAGRLARDSALPTADLTVRKLAAIAALARHEAATAPMLDSLAVEPGLLPTSALLDWLDVLRLVPDVKSREARTTAAEQALRSRLTLGGTGLVLSGTGRDELPWLMVSTESNAARTVLAALDRPAWRDDVPRLVRGLLAKQDRGHWGTTTANAWSKLALQRYSARYEATPVTGTTNVALAGGQRAVSWPLATNAAGTSGTVSFPWPAAPSAVQVTHAGTGKPWAFVQASAAVPLTAPLQAGFSIRRSVTPVEQQTPARWTRGDVVRVRLELDAQADATWVVVDDPVPAGATILGTGLGGQSQRLASGERRSGGAWPAFEERRFEAFRAYYRYVPKGRWTVEYTVRLNNPGTFQLPATRVEAMYAPETYAESPNPPLTIAAP